VIDAHHHLWDISARELRWLSGDQVWASDEELARLRRSFTLADLLPQAAAAGVNGTVVVQTVLEPWETPDLLALAAGLDPWGTGGPALGGFITGVVGWTDLTAPDVADAVARLRLLPGGDVLAGIRHPLLAEADPGWLVRKPVLRGLRAVAAAGLCFDLVALPSQLESAVAAARQVPELTFVLDHLGGPPADRDDGGWASAIGSFGELPNVVCKLSGAHMDPATATALRPYFQTVLVAFGPGRLMFGSDWPVSALTAPYQQICDLYRELTAGLTHGEQSDIFDVTARRVYRLRAPEFGWFAYQPRPA
jgi:L-fuconolactonase